ncbi:MAG TPA: OmpH family outer membrane protein [Rhizomicrobium sp.]|jgi:Skp family chaperone for outer membrane proteins
MFSKKIIAGTLGGIIVAGAASVAAMAAAPAPAQQSSFGGPSITGLCILDQQAVFNGSKVGVSANTRYKQMRDGAQSAVSAEEAKIVADAKTLQAQKLAPAQLQPRQQQLAKRFQDLRAKASQDSKDLEATRQAAVAKIAAAAQPVIKQVYDQRKCGVLIARNSALAGNATMDVTSAVIQGLDAKITTIALDKQAATSAKH